MRIIAGAVDTTEIVQPTGMQFGQAVKRKDVLYVDTAGILAFSINEDI